MMHDTRYPFGHEEGSEKRSRAKGCKAVTTSDKERTSQVSYVRLSIIFFRAFRVCYHTMTTSIPYCIESEIGFFVNYARALSVVGHRQNRRELKGPVPRLCHSSGVLVCMYYLYRKCTASRAEARTSIENNFKQGARPRRTCDGRVGPSRSAVPLDLHHLSSICLLGSGGCLKKRKGLLYEKTERAKGRVAGHR